MAERGLWTRNLWARPGCWFAWCAAWGSGFLALAIVRTCVMIAYPSPWGIAVTIGSYLMAAAAFYASIQSPPEE